jgi:hypothetical protein
MSHHSNASSFRKEPNLSRSYHQAMESVKKIAISVIGPLVSRIEAARAITGDALAHVFNIRVTIFSTLATLPTKKLPRCAQILEGKAGSC